MLQPTDARPARPMDLTPDLVARSLRPVPDSGQDSGWTRMSEAEQHAIADRLLDEADGAPLWVFAYGSLIWKPEFVPAQTLRATAVGWHRSFCLEMQGWRATPEQPGLMMALDRGGRCTGVALRLAEAERREGLRRAVRREVVFHEFADMVRWVPLATEHGPLRALVFWAGPRPGPGIALKLPLATVAHRLARACGPVGSCAEYLYNTVSHLEQMGIRDRNLWRLQEMVAAELRGMGG